MDYTPLGKSGESYSFKKNEIMGKKLTNVKHVWKATRLDHVGINCLGNSECPKAHTQLHQPCKTHDTEGHQVGQVPRKFLDIHCNPESTG